MDADREHIRFPAALTDDPEPRRRLSIKGKAGAAAGLALLAGSLLLSGRPLFAETKQVPLVHLAELEIDPTHLDAYKAALREEIATSIRVEPGVLKLYAVSVKGHPSQIRLFEMYASTAAYQQHLASTHFLKYKSSTAGMVTSLQLLETEPILLGAK